MTDAEKIAAKVGVCRQTVSAVLNGNLRKVSAKNRQAILAAADELRYVPNLNAKALSGRSVRTIGSILPSMKSPLMPYLLDCIHGEITQRGYTCYLITPSNASEEQTAVREFCSRRFDGMIIFSLFRQFDFKHCSIPAVISGARLDSSEISTDFGYGMLLALEHLHDFHGHRNLVLLTDCVEGNVAKYESFKRFVQSRPSVKSRVIEVSKESSPNRAILNCVREGFTAFASTGDILAGNALNLFGHAGIRVPEDVAVTGYDGLLLSASGYLQLSSVIHPVRETARRCIDLLFRKIAGLAPAQMAQTERLRPMFFKGMSCGCSGYQPELSTNAPLPEYCQDDPDFASCLVRNLTSAPL